MYIEWNVHVELNMNTCMYKFLLSNSIRVFVVTYCARIHPYVLYHLKIFGRSANRNGKRWLVVRIFIRGRRPRCHRRVVVVVAITATALAVVSNHCRRLRVRWRCLSKSIWIYGVFLLRRLGRTFLKRHAAETLRR